MDTPWIYRIIEQCLSWIWPNTPDIEYLEHISPKEFSIQAHRPVEKSEKDTYCLFSYRDPLVQKALWALKYRGNRRMARLFAHLIYDSLIETLSEEQLFSGFTDPIIIPVPLSAKRHRDRGWNQTEMICRELVKLQPQWNLKTHILVKVKHTAPQTTLRRTERLKNLKGCFSVQNKHEIVGRNIILIDDVTTTGSTLNEARRALLEAGARRVLAIAVAH